MAHARAQSGYTTLIQCDGQARYWSDFLGQNANAYLSASIHDIPWQEKQIVIYGKTHAIPRLSAWYSDTGATYTYSGITMHGAALPDFVSEIRTKICETTGYQFNSVLMNYYRHGRDKVGWHSDNEPELGKKICIASISLGAERVFRWRHKLLPDKRHVTLAHGSLLLMESPMQVYWEHCLPANAKLNTPRVNLTFRNIP